MEGRLCILGTIGGMISDMVYSMLVKDLDTTDSMVKRWSYE